MKNPATKNPTLSTIARLRGHIMAAATQADNGQIEDARHHLERALDMLVTIENELTAPQNTPGKVLPFIRAKGVH